MEKITVDLKIIEMAVRDGVAIGLARIYSQEQKPMPGQIVDYVSNSVVHEIIAWTKNGNYISLTSKDEDNADTPAISPDQAPT
jgi:hypothetical protein